MDQKCLEYDRSSSLPIFEQNLTDIGLIEKLQNMTWFHQIGEKTKKRLLVGLVSKIRNYNSLEKLHEILNLLLSCDYVYSMSQHNFHQLCDTPSTSSDRAIPFNLAKIFIEDLISWFGSLESILQIKFVVQILKKVQSYHILGVLTKLTSLLIKRRKFKEDAIDRENRGKFDIVGKLPNNIVQYLFHLLDKQSLINASIVSGLWYHKVNKYLDNLRAMRDHQNYIICHFLPGDVYNQNYAGIVKVKVPSGHGRRPSRVEVEMEVRNIYFQPYNFIPLFKCRERYVTGIGKNGKVVAISGKQNSINLVKFNEKYEKTTTIFKGHVGSIRAFVVNPDFLYSASYDTTIRKWNITQKKCAKIFLGHINTVNDIKALKELIFSASSDCTCKIWNVNTGKCLHTFSHTNPVMRIAIFADFLASGDKVGILRTYSLTDFKLNRTYKAHNKEITCIFPTKWYLLTSSKDSLVKCWGRSESSLTEISTLSHPGVVVDAALIYLRVVTACHDGKIRIWSLYKGECIKIIRATAKCEPIRHIFVSETSIIVCTRNIVALLAFETVDLRYDEEEKVPRVAEEETQVSQTKDHVRPYSRIRSHRMHYIQSANSAILRNLTHVSSSNVRFEDEQLPHTSYPVSYSGVTNVLERSQTELSMEYKKFNQSKMLDSKKGKRSSSGRTIKMSESSENNEKLKYLSHIQSIQSIKPIRCNMLLKTFSSENENIENI